MLPAEYSRDPRFSIRAVITDKEQDADDRWLYGWRMQIINGVTGDMEDVEPFVGGTTDNSPAFELNNAEVNVGTQVRMNLRGMRHGSEPIWEFTSPGSASSTMAWVRVTSLTVYERTISGTPTSLNVYPAAVDTPADHHVNQWVLGVDDSVGIRPTNGDSIKLGDRYLCSLGYIGTGAPIAGVPVYVETIPSDAGQEVRGIVGTGADNQYLGSGNKMFFTNDPEDFGPSGGSEFAILVANTATTVTVPTLCHPHGFILDGIQDAGFIYKDLGAGSPTQRGHSLYSGLSAGVPYAELFLCSLGPVSPCAIINCQTFVVGDLWAYNGNFKVHSGGSDYTGETAVINIAGLTSITVKGGIVVAHA